MSETPLCIGIDLGTTNSVIAYYNTDSDTVEIIPNNLGERITPSCVLYTGDEVYVGQNALDVAGEDQPIVSHVKRFIGLKQSQCQESLDQLEYEIEVNHQGYPLISVNNKKYKPEEVSAEILHYLKKCAEDALGRKITEAVVTVPAYFNNSQLRATKDACTIAGLDCLRLVAEPTAACLCYGLHKRDRERVLVFDLGGGTLDCSIVNIIGGIFEVLGTSGNTQLGGADVDHMLLEFIQSKYREETGKEPPMLTQSYAEKIKKTLSNVKQAVIRLPNFTYTLTRSHFEEIINDFIEACFEPVDQVLKDTKLRTDDISQVVLVGGSTRIPVIQERLKDMFGANVPINKSINPDEAVAYGAAVQASSIKNVGSKAKELLLLDVTPLSLGIETSGGIMNPIIKRNSTLPCDCSKIYSTVDDNQESVDIKVFQGEREFTRDCIPLGVFTLEGLPRRPRGVPKIKVTFKLDSDGLLEISAVDKNTGLANQITINNDSNLSKEEIDHLVSEAEKFRAQDQMKRKTLEEMNRFEKYIYEVQRLVNLEEMKVVLGNDLSPTNQYLMNTLDWIAENMNTSDLETVQNARTNVEYNLKPYLERMYSHRKELEQAGFKLDEKQVEEQSIEHINQLIEEHVMDVLGTKD